MGFFLSPVSCLLSPQTNSNALALRKTILLDWSVPLVILVGLTIPFWVTDLDLTLARRFFDPTGDWVYKDVQPWRWLYDYGTLPAWIVALTSLGALIGSVWIRRIAPYRRIALFFVLVMIAGPGLVVNVVFKDHWGRTRPRNVEAFGGDRPFLHAWEKGVTGKGKSFPCGHASTGFFLCSPFFVFRKRSRKWAMVFLVLGLGYGSLMGLGRMVQGGHFASDVIWSGGFVYLCGLGFYYLLRLDSVSVRRRA